MARPKGSGGRSKIASRISIEREPAGGVARVRLGSYELGKKGVSRFDLSDPYHLAVALTWPQFLAALLVLYLSVNVVFATLFWLARFPRDATNFGRNRRPMFGQRIERIGVSSAGLPFFSK